MASGQDSSGTTLMDLITSDPSATSTAGASSQQQSSSGVGGSLLGKPVAPPADRKSKKGTLTQIQNETISAAKALNPVKVLPQRNRKKKARPLPLSPHHFHPLFIRIPVSCCSLCFSCSPSPTRSWSGASTSSPRRATRFVRLLLRFGTLVIIA